MTHSKHTHWYNIHGCAYARAIADRFADSKTSSLLVVVSDDSEARALKKEIRVFIGSRCDIIFFPDWETLPYDRYSPPPRISAMRIAVLVQLLEGVCGIYICSAATLCTPLAPCSFFRNNSFRVAKGDVLDIEDFSRNLTANGYRKVPQVGTWGEFAVRGAIVDLFSPHIGQPVRIDLLDDEVEDLREFDLDNQISLRSIPDINVLPAREFPFNDAAIVLFRKQFRSIFSNYCEASAYHDISNGILCGGVEYYLPLFFPKVRCFIDYFSSSSTILIPPQLDTELEMRWENVHTRFEEKSQSDDTFVLHPEKLFFSPKYIRRKIEKHQNLTSHRFFLPPNVKDSVSLGAAKPPPVALSFESHTPMAQKLKHFLTHFKGRVLLSCSSLSRQEQLIPILEKQSIVPREVKSWEDFVATESPLCYLQSALQEGAVWKDEGLGVIVCEEIFGKESTRLFGNRQRWQKIEKIRKVSDLEIGKPVVHEEYGIGRFEGLKSMCIREVRTDFCVLRYADGDKLLVPIYSLHLLSSYVGIDADCVKESSLNSNKWKKARNKATKHLWDTAAEILDTQARRLSCKGVACDLVVDGYQQFCALFPFEETPDQQKTTEAVLRDMARPTPMDRVVCADVGFGKTEIALRAAFVAAFNGKQVLMLAPTTILAKQHYETFSQRFAKFPVNIRLVSRLQMPSSFKKTVEELRCGICDIAIGTHKLLNDSIILKDPGLLIVDEEHRFGVRDKEKIKSAYVGTDILTLTATPIPRTLHMSLCGLRDFSLMETPPPERSAIRTYITTWSDSLIRESCDRELLRGGQIYFVNHDIKGLRELATTVGKLVGKARVAIAHGRLSKHELEQVMLDFYQGRIRVLVCTTIIESGIDNPNANTIFVKDANFFGLAQLHQLRGRVGRSYHSAYAYFLVDKHASISAEGKKRLVAINEMSGLGDGHTLASHDLEIRGAGKLLGAEQSGHVQEIGMHLYNCFLKRAVDVLKSGLKPSLDIPLFVNCDVYVREASLLPEEYLPDVNLRILLYRRISMMETIEEVQDIRDEIIDRFGRLPKATQNLFLVAALRVRCRQQGIARVDAMQTGVRLQFTDKPHVNIHRILSLIKKNPRRYCFASPTELVISQSPRDRMASKPSAKTSMDDPVKQGKQVFIGTKDCVQIVKEFLRAVAN